MLFPFKQGEPAVSMGLARFLIRDSLLWQEFIARVTSHIPDKGQVSLEGELTSPFQRSLRSLPPLLGLRPATKGAYPLGSRDGFFKPKQSL